MPLTAAGIPATRLRAGRQHVLETAFGLLSSAPTATYLMSFIVRMRYCPDTDSCQVVIQPNYSPADEHDEEIRNEIVTPLSHEIRATLGEKISRKTCGYLSASSTMDEDNLADLFILYFFLSRGDGEGEPRSFGLGSVPDEPVPPHLCPRDGGDRRECPGEVPLRHP